MWPQRIDAVPAAPQAHEGSEAAEATPLGWSGGEGEAVTEEEKAREDKEQFSMLAEHSDDDDIDSNSEENTKTEDKVRVPAVCWRASCHSAPKAALGRTAAARLCLVAGRGSAAAAPL